MLHEVGMSVGQPAAPPPSLALFRLSSCSRLPRLSTLAQSLLFIFLLHVSSSFPTSPLPSFSSPPRRNERKCSSSSRSYGRSAEEGAPPPPWPPRGSRRRRSKCPRSKCSGSSSSSSSRGWGCRCSSLGWACRREWHRLGGCRCSRRRSSQCAATRAEIPGGSERE